MKQQRILVCEDSLEGILSGVHQAYSSRYGVHDIHLVTEEPQPQLFTEIFYVDTDFEKAKSVAKAVQEKISGYAFHMIHFASCSTNKDKAQAIYRLLVYGFYVGEKAVNHRTDPWINLVHKLERQVWREQHNILGFLRFQEVGGRFLLGKFKPMHNVLQLITEHFADRFSTESWVICDEGRQLACIYTPETKCHIVSYDGSIGELLHMEDTEMDSYDVYGKLWKTFFDSVFIKQRENKRQQLNMAPKRYHAYMPEMKK